ncbi:hypothetical protein ACF1HU_21095 [Streptomyces olivaceus]|uniref:hypothetical protein n=1 Tax=Streptomyces olivaceus TaxID=47716 RepID=UPI0036FCD32B
MKITRIETFLVPPRWLFCRVETDDGVVGWGEPVVEGRAEVVRAAVDVLAEYLVGHRASASTSTRRPYAPPTAPGTPGGTRCGGTRTGRSPSGDPDRPPVPVPGGASRRLTVAVAARPTDPHQPEKEARQWTCEPP